MAQQQQQFGRNINNPRPADTGEKMLEEVLEALPHDFVWGRFMTAKRSDLPQAIWLAARVTGTLALKVDEVLPGRWEDIDRVINMSGPLPEVPKNLPQAELDSWIFVVACLVYELPMGWLPPASLRVPHA